MKDVGRRAAQFVVIAGAATIVSALAMRVIVGGQIQPQRVFNEAGFKTAMLGLELANSPEEVFEILGPSNSEAGQSLRSHLSRTNACDYAFLVCYSLLNGCLIVFVTCLNTYRFAGLIKLKAFMVLGLILAGAMVVGDIVENLAISNLLRAETASDVTRDAMVQLMYWTRVKWGAIALTSLMLSAGYTAYFRRIPPLLMPAGFAVAGVSCLIAITLPDARFILERITVPHLAIMWSAAMVHAAIFWKWGPHPSLLPVRVGSSASVNGSAA